MSTKENNNPKNNKKENEEQTDDFDQVVKRVGNLDKKINTLQQTMTDVVSKIQDTNKQTEQKTPEVKTENLFDQSDLSEAMDDPEKMSKILKSAFQAQTEALMGTMPEMMNKLANNQFKRQKKLNQFWDDNEDLKELAPFVSEEVEKLSGENPGMNLDTILETAESNVRSKFDIQKQAEETEEERKNQQSNSNESDDSEGSFANNSGTRDSSSGGAKTPADEQESQMDEMLETLS